MAPNEEKNKNKNTGQETSKVQRKKKKKRSLISKGRGYQVMKHARREGPKERMDSSRLAAPPPESPQHPGAGERGGLPRGGHPSRPPLLGRRGSVCSCRGQGMSVLPHRPGTHAAHPSRAALITALAASENTDSKWLLPSLF